jgi:radical SAM superfamily enzyme YgiQ (UPF0313 family)
LAYPDSDRIFGAMADIVLATLNAKFIHSAFGLRCLRANLGELRPRSEIAEFDIHLRPQEIVERILALKPRLVGLGIYIWNVVPSTQVVALLKRLRPDLPIVLGGPEVSHEVADQEIVRLADHVIPGEADLAFGPLCASLLETNPQATRPPKIVLGPLPTLEQLPLPYDEYTDEDIAHRLIYVEASRGCPFECEFCLSSLDVPVRQFPLEPFLEAMNRLLERGVRHFKFVDRTFNLKLSVSRAILDFFAARLVPDLFLHFELVPDRLPDGLRESIARFPAGSLQFEIGIQTFNPEVAGRIGRRQDYAALADNLRFLRHETRAHIHADLIVGLPGEDLASFASGFDQLVALQPQEIQVGILKRLRGTPIGRHDAAWNVVWSPIPPYEILENRLLDFTTLRRLTRFARYWDLVANSGNFLETTPQLWHDGSPFSAFLRFSDWLHARLGRQHSIALPVLTRALFDYLTMEAGLSSPEVGSALARDFLRPGRRDVPPFLQPWAPAEPSPVSRRNRTARRQARHRESPQD